MKLLLCKTCQDVIRLFAEERQCKCGAVRGRYVDDVNSVYSGDSAVPLGFSNSSLVSAMHNQPNSGLGRRFDAFVIPRNCPSYNKE